MYIIHVYVVDVPVQGSLFVPCQKTAVLPVYIYDSTQACLASVSWPSLAYLLQIYCTFCS